MKFKRLALILGLLFLMVTLTFALSTIVFGANGKEKKPLTGMNDVNDAILQLEQQLTQAQQDITLLQQQINTNSNVETIIWEPNSDLTINNSEERFWLLIGSVTNLQNIQGAYYKCRFYIDGVLVDWDSGGPNSIVGIGDEFRSQTFEYFHPVVLPAGPHTLRFNLETFAYPDPIPGEPYIIPPPPTYERAHFVCIGY